YAFSVVEENFKSVRLRGDSAFNLTYKYDEWDKAGVEFCFGCHATENLRETAAKLGKNRWQSFRSPRRKNAGKPESQKERQARERNFSNIQAHREHVAEFNYRPTRCAREYRIVVVRKQLILSGGQRGLFGELDTRYFFYVTNIENESPASIVDFIHKRCDHENRIEQLKNGMPALHTPCAGFQANQAWMLIGILAHNIKSWLCLMHPEPAARRRLLSFEFKSFFREFILIPCQVLRTGRRLVLRFLTTTREFADLIAILRAISQRPA